MYKKTALLMFCMSVHTCNAARNTPLLLACQAPQNKRSDYQSSGRHHICQGTFVTCCALGYIALNRALEASLPCSEMRDTGTDLCAAFTASDWIGKGLGAAGVLQLLYGAAQKMRAALPALNDILRE